MPDYGVDTDEWSPLPWSWAAAKLDGGRNYWIVTASAAGRPHAMPTWGVWDEDDRRFAFSCGPRSRRRRTSPPTHRSPSPSTTPWSACRSRGAPSGDRDALAATWIDRYIAKYQSIAPDLSADFLRQNLIIVVVPERAFAVIEREEEFATRATRWRF